MDNQNNDEDDDQNGACYFPQRYMATLLAFVTLCHGFFCRCAFHRALSIIVAHKHPKRKNVTINCQDLETEESTKSDISQIYEGILYDWDKNIKGKATRFYFCAYLGFHPFAGYLSDRYGAKYIVAVAIAGMTLTLLFIPTFIDKTDGNPISVYIASFATGFFHSFLLPGVATFLSHWIPKRERTLLCSIAFSGIFYGLIIKNVATGSMIRKLNDWTVPCYLYGGIGTVVFIFWWFYSYSDPISNPYMLRTERNYLKREMREIVDHRRKSVPLMKIFLSLEVWALVFGSFGHLWLYSYAFGFIKKYMLNVLNFSLNHSRIWSATPYIALIISSYVNGFFADWILKNDHMNLLTLRKVYTNIGTMGPAIYMTVASFTSCHRDVFKAMYLIANALAGFVFAGIRMVPMDIAPNYSGILTAVTNAVGLSSHLFMHKIIHVKSKTMDGYTAIFFVILGVAAASNIIYVICSRIKLQEWNTPTRTKEKNK